MTPTTKPPPVAYDVWTLFKGKGDEMHEVRTLGGKIALVFELSDAKQIVSHHNSHEALVQACEQLLAVTAANYLASPHELENAQQQARAALALAKTQP